MIRRILFILMLALAMTNDVTAQGLKGTDSIMWAIVNVSCCNLRTSGDYDAGMETQGLLGMPLRILENGTWLEVETPDGTPAWVLRSSLQLVTKEQLEHWNNSPMVVVTSMYGFVYEKPDVNSQHVSDVVASDRLKLLGQKGAFYNVEYPDGRKGYLSINIASKITDWRKSLKHDAKSIIATAQLHIGLPYMWGGASTKGVDCSGFIRTVFMQHDISMVHNASKQSRLGEHIVISPDFSNLLPGDLVFFGRKATDDNPAHVSHVGMYLGNKKFIHSLGCVHISSFNPADREFDEYDLNRLLWAQRVLPFINKEKGLQTTDNNEFYQ